MTAISCRTAISDADTDTINYTVPLSNYIESGLQYPEYPTQSSLIKSADIKATYQAYYKRSKKYNPANSH